MTYVIPQIPNVAFLNVLKYFLKEYSYNMQFFKIFYITFILKYLVFTNVLKSSQSGVLKGK